MNAAQKKQIKYQQILLGKTSKKQRAALWQYILKGDLSVGYFDAQQLQRRGIMVLKPIPYYEDQPN